MAFMQQDYNHPPIITPTIQIKASNSMYLLPQKLEGSWNAKYFRKLSKSHSNRSAVQLKLEKSIIEIYNRSKKKIGFAKINNA